MAAPQHTYEQIIGNCRSGQYASVYLLMGEEDYYIHQITEFIEKNAVDEASRDFNLSVFYGADYEREVGTIVAAARQVPMMGDRQVVILKEAQMCLNSRWKERNHEALCGYLKNPAPSTVLVLCYMHGNFDSRKQLVKLIREHGVVFEAKTPAEHELARFATAYMKERGLEMDVTTAQLVADYVGRDLSRLTGELQKLIVVLKDGEQRVTLDHVEQNIGISRKYNVFELQNALIDKDIARCMKIVDHMGRNPKDNPIQFSLPILFSFFSNLMQAYYAPEKSDRGIAAFLSASGGRPMQAWQVAPYLKAMRHYSGMKVMHIIRRIRTADARSKGVDATSAYSDAANLRELIHFILH